jgi:hypothetical protein
MVSIFSWSIVMWTGPGSVVDRYVMLLVSFVIGLA